MVAWFCFDFMLLRLHKLGGFSTLHRLFVSHEMAEMKHDIGAGTTNLLSPDAVHAKDREERNTSTAPAR